MTKINVHWGIFSMATFLLIIGFIAIFNQTIQRTYVNGFFFDVISNPHITMGIVVAIIGFALLILSLFMGEVPMIPDETNFS